MAVFCGAACRRTSFWCSRLLSTYVTKTLEGVLAKFGQDAQRIEESVLIGCSDQREAWFALDLGLKSSSSKHVSLPQSEMEAELKGSFIKLRKVLFQLNSTDSSLLFTMAPVVITLVSDGPRCLLARQSSFPKGFYSALAGFCDIGESVEEAIHREVAEEVGLEVERLEYSASQHWPFPNSSLMIACHATAKPGQTEIQLNLRELEAAAWFSCDEVVSALKRTGTSMQPKDETFPFSLPPKLAIAHQLIKEWVEKQTCSSLSAQ
uniref:NAD(+) diphosphatase n=1 Tax=Jaculus jaculus TaxID=51337 RepID=A0A8C5L7V7_JACJA